MVKVTLEREVESYDRIFALEDVGELPVNDWVEKLLPVQNGVLVLQKNGGIDLLAQDGEPSLKEVSLNSPKKIAFDHDLIAPLTQGTDFYFLEEGGELGLVKVIGLNATIKYFFGNQNDGRESSLAYWNGELYIGREDGKMTVISTSNINQREVKVRNAKELAYLNPNSSSMYAASNDGKVYQLSEDLKLTHQRTLKPIGRDTANGTDINEALHVPDYGVFVVGDRGIVALLSDEDLKVQKQASLPNMRDATHVVYGDGLIHVSGGRTVYTMDASTLELLGSKNVQSGSTTTIETMAMDQDNLVVGIGRFVQIYKPTTYLKVPITDFKPIALPVTTS